MKIGIAVAFLALSVAAQLPTFAQTRGKDKPPPLEPLAWYDANGKLVGRLAGPSYVVLNFGGFVTAKVELVPPDPATGAWRLGGRVTPIGMGVIWYLQPNCLGTPYINARQELGPFAVDQRLSAGTLQSGDLAIAVGAAASPIELTFSSYTDNIGITCTSSSVTTPAVPVEAIYNLNELFPAPLISK